MPADRVPGACGIDATLYVCTVNPLEVVFNSQPITAMPGFASRTAPEMMLATVNDLMHPEDLGRFVAHVERLHTVHDGEIASFRHRMLAATGQWAHCFPVPSIRRMSPRAPSCPGGAR